MIKRDIKNKVIFGICAGLAKQWGIDPLWVRIAFVVLGLHGTAGILIYLIMWLLMPKETEN